MHAERVFLETDEFGNLKAVPPLPPKSRVEAIFLVLPEDATSEARRPRPELAGKIRIKGDLLAPVVEEADWDALR